MPRLLAQIGVEAEVAAEDANGVSGFDVDLAAGGGEVEEAALEPGAAGGIIIADRQVEGEPARRDPERLHNAERELVAAGERMGLGEVERPGVGGEPAVRDQSAGAGD